MDHRTHVHSVLSTPSIILTDMYSCSPVVTSVGKAHGRTTGGTCYKKLSVLSSMAVTDATYPKLCLVSFPQLGSSHHQGPGPTLARGRVRFRASVMSSHHGGWGVTLGIPLERWREERHSLPCITPLSGQTMLPGAAAAIL